MAFFQTLLKLSLVCVNRWRYWLVSPASVTIPRPGGGETNVYNDTMATLQTTETVGRGGGGGCS